jgi:hypothetical protein
MEKLVLDKDKAAKLLCILERSLVQGDDIDHDKKIELMDLQSDFIDELGEFLGVDLYEGCIDPYTFGFKKFS